MRYLRHKLEGADNLYFDKQTVRVIANELTTTNTEVIEMYGRLTNKDAYLDQKVDENYTLTFVDLLVDENPSAESILINQ